ncbi:MAG: hypothetical protein ACKO65_10045 [Betaproteobacteria bacterium]
MKFFLVLSLLLQPFVAYAVYRCESSGKISYSDLPCAGSQLAISQASSTTDSADPVSKNERSEVSRLQKLREQRERQDQQIRDLAARGAAARERKCRSLALQVKWREEDVRESTLDKAHKAKIRLRRATEKFDSECR